MADHISTLAHLHSVFKNVIERDEKFELDNLDCGEEEELDDNGESKSRYICTILEEFDRTERAQRDGLGDDPDRRIIPSKADRASEGLQVLEKIEKLRRKVNATWALKLVQKLQQSLHAVESQHGIEGINKWLQELTIVAKHEFTYVHIGEGRKMVDIPTIMLNKHACSQGGFLKRMRGNAEGHLCLLRSTSPTISDHSLEQ